MSTDRYMRNPPHDEKKWFETSMNMQTPALDDVLKNCIEKIWDKYDADGSGYLDREETQVFVKESITSDPDGDEADDES